MKRKKQNVNLDRHLMKGGTLVTDIINETKHLCEFLKCCGHLVEVLAGIRGKKIEIISSQQNSQNAY